VSGSGAVSCSSLLLFGSHSDCSQAETPLISLSKFPEPTLSERLDIVPAQFWVLVTRRPKYACRRCEDVVVHAPAPARLIEGGLPTEATVAHVLVAKYADHLPLYRQAQIYARQGINQDRSTLAEGEAGARTIMGTFE
jgi:transposase